VRFLKTENILIKIDIDICVIFKYYMELQLSGRKAFMYCEGSEGLKCHSCCETSCSGGDVLFCVFCFVFHLINIHTKTNKEERVNLMNTLRPLSLARDVEVMRDDEK